MTAASWTLFDHSVGFMSFQAVIPISRKGGEQTGLSLPPRYN